MPITKILEFNSKRYPDKVALIEIDYNHIYRNKKNNYSSAKGPHRKEITWRSFNNASNKLAHCLLKSDAQDSCKIAILMKNRIEWLPIFFGILKSGGVAVLLNCNFSLEEVQNCLKLTECSQIIFSEEYSEIINNIYETMPTVKRFISVDENHESYVDYYYDLLSYYPAIDPDIVIDDHEPAVIYFSSGTTGLSKAILHSHNALMAAAKTEQKHHGQTFSDIFLIIPPLYHAGAQIHWLGSLISGGSAVILNTNAPRAIIETIATERITIAWLLMASVRDILDSIDCGDISLDKYDLSLWRLMHMGAQPIPRVLIQRWLETFPTQQYDTNYGLTESAGPGCIHLGTNNSSKAGSIGKAGVGWTVSILDETGQSVSSGTVGELAVKGASIMLGYYKDPYATSKVFKNGWLLTGDLAFEDNEGFIYLVDRKKDLIISGGENISPVQIEDYLRDNFNIKDVAVIGFPDYRLGEIVGAIIELKDFSHCSRTDIFNYCKNLPVHKRPRKIFFDVIPRSETGKIQKNKLRDKYINLLSNKKEISKWN